MNIDLHRIARQNHIQELENVDSKELNLDSIDQFGATPLHYGIVNKSTEVVDWLLNAGADVTIQDRRGNTALHLAVEYYMPTIADAIIEKNPEVVQIEDAQGNQPLWVAVFKARSDFAIVKLLIDNGADVNHLNAAGMSPLDMARRKKNVQLHKLLASVPDGMNRPVS